MTNDNQLVSLYSIPFLGDAGNKNIMFMRGTKRTELYLEGGPSVVQASPTRRVF